MEVLAACHVHSVWSYDGSWPLEELSLRFSQRGYRVLLMTEHDRGFTEERYERYRYACAEASSRQILVVPGIEYSDSDNRAHVLVWGARSFLGENLSTGELIERVRVAGGVAVFAHPGRKSAWKVFEQYSQNPVLGIEVWNRKYDGWAPSKTAPALLKASSAIPFVGLDFHTHRQSFPLAMALDVDGEISEETVLQCLRLRRCRARTFGLPINHVFLRRSLPALTAAETARRAASLMWKSGRAFTLR
jgi:predicted metal-dependent phosphoesterase TrpH